MAAFIKQCVCKGLSSCRVLLASELTPSLHSNCGDKKAFSRTLLCNKVKVRGNVIQLTKNTFNRRHSTNIQITEISQRQNALGVSSLFHRQVLLKPKFDFNKLRVAFYRSWNADMVEQQKRTALPVGVGKDSEPMAKSAGLKQVHDDIIKYFKSLHTHEIDLTGRKRILLYDNVNDESDEYCARLHKIWKWYEEKDKTTYILPEDSDCHKNVMAKITKMHKQMKLEFPGGIASRFDDKWKVIILDNPHFFQAMATSNANIYVAKQLIDEMSDTHLAFTIGHEMSHVYMQHDVEKYSLEDFYDGFIHTLMGITEEVAPKWANFRKESVASRWREELYQLFPDKYIHEYEADHLGLLLATKAGYNPKECVQMLRYLQAKNVDNLFDFHDVDGFDASEMQMEKNPALRVVMPWMHAYLKRKPKWVATHPDLEERFEALSKIIDEMGIEEGQGETQRERSKSVPASMKFTIS